MSDEAIAALALFGAFFAFGKAALIAMRMWLFKDEPEIPDDDDEEGSR